MRLQDRIETKISTFHIRRGGEEKEGQKDKGSGELGKGLLGSFAGNRLGPRKKSWGGRGIEKRCRASWSITEET